MSDKDINIDAFGEWQNAYNKSQPNTNNLTTFTSVPTPIKIGRAHV